jgi:hypothetical protein
MGTLNEKKVDGKKFHQFQQNEQPLTSNHWTQIRLWHVRNVGNPGHIFMPWVTFFL